MKKGFVVVKKAVAMMMAVCMLLTAGAVGNMGAQPSGGFEAITSIIDL